MFSKNFTKSEGSSFIKLEENETVVGAFAGTPLEYMNNFKLRSQYPVGLGTYPEGTSKRFKVNFVSATEDGALVPRILEGSKTTASGIDAILEKYGMEYFYEVKRTGQGTKTRYSVLPERPLTEEEKGKIKTLELHELKIRTPDAEE